jgi:hypothetical protein
VQVASEAVWICVHCRMPSVDKNLTVVCPCKGGADASQQIPARSRLCLLLAAGSDTTCWLASTPGGRQLVMHDGDLPNAQS